MQPWYVYIIRCSDASLYTGVTTDVERRFAEHKEGGRKGSKYARAKIPIRVVYVEICTSRSEAQKREYVIKQMTRPAKEELIKGASKKS